MTRGVDGKVAVVIGGASGIGWAAAQALTGAGALLTVADIDIDVDEAAARAADLGGPAQGRRVDVTDEDSVRALFEETVADRGEPIGIMVNSAGGNLPGLICELAADSWRQTIDLCLTGAFFAIKHAARSMSRGGVVNIASLNVRQPAEGFAGYCAAKAGLVMLTEVAALELASQGIRVNAVSPGLVETPLVRMLTGVPQIQADFTDNTPLGRNEQPDDIAEAVLYLSSAASSWVTGEVLNVNGGAHLRRYPDVMKHVAAMSRPTVQDNDAGIV